MRPPVERRSQASRGTERGTREEILTAASNLFAVHGYYGTTTREIALAVGVRQPSLFHHFESKSAIMEALLKHDLGKAVPARERVARSDRPAAERLYRYLFDEVTHITGSPYNLAGVYTDEVRSSPEFEPWHRQRRRLHRAIERILADGDASGEFIPLEPTFVREAILGIVGRTLSYYGRAHGTPDTVLADQVACLVLRSILVDVSSLDKVRDAVHAEIDVAP
jgi:AcrR family transcriptional regulator